MDSTSDFSEKERSRVLRGYHILDTAPEPQFDDLATLAASICDTPMALITLVDGFRQWFKARVNFPLEEIPRDSGFCGVAIRQRDLFIVPDAQVTPRFANDPLVTGDPYVRFYAGTPLVTEDGCAIGTLCVLDHVPRRLNNKQKQALQILGREVLGQLELRKTLGALKSLVVEHDSAAEELQMSYRVLEERIAERTNALNKVNALLKAEVEERAREAQFTQAIIDSLPCVFYVIDQDGNHLRWNKNLERVTGYTPDEIRQLRTSDFFCDEDEKELIRERLLQVFREGCASVEAQLFTKNGERIPYYFTGAKVSWNGHDYISGMGVDITELLEVEETLRLQNRALQASINAIMITDLDGNIVYANPAFEKITGYPVSEAIGRNTSFLVGDDRKQLGLITIRHAMAHHEECAALLRNYRKNGDMFWNDLHIAPVRTSDGTTTHFVEVLNDITEIKRYEEELEQHANYDSLTALVNRNVLMDRIRQAIAAAQREDRFVTIGFMDLDNFKFINDSHGHTVGDELLKQVAERLVTCLRDEDTIARYGGDEFAFVLVGQQSEKTIADLMSRMLKTVERPFMIADHKFYVSCSIGLSFYPKDGQDVETLLKNADVAMYRAKERGRNNFQFYTPAMNKRVTERLALESRLRQALADGEFALHYQPKVDLGSGRIVGVEALLRWYPSGGGMVSPATFIPLAEETGLIVPIGEWVLNTACAHIKALQEINQHPMRVAVNISARQFEPTTLVTLVRRALGASGLNPGMLELELTESLVMQNPEEAIKVLHELKEMGLQLAIDDFGTGHSSLSYLQRFPVDHLKIDQSFVRDIGDDPNDAIIARAVIVLGHNLGKRVVAEGVSNAEQLAFLRQNQCDEMQGFFFSKAVPIEQLTMLLKDNSGLSLH